MTFAALRLLLGGLQVPQMAVRHQSQPVYLCPCMYGRSFSMFYSVFIDNKMILTLYFQAAAGLSDSLILCNRLWRLVNEISGQEYFFALCYALLVVQNTELFSDGLCFGLDKRYILCVKEYYKSHTAYFADLSSKVQKNLVKVLLFNFVTINYSGVSMQ